MSTESLNTIPQSGTIPGTTDAACENGACQTRLCSPCLIVWGVKLREALKTTMEQQAADADEQRRTTRRLLGN
jgi:hypothetical protein